MTHEHIKLNDAELYSLTMPVHRTGAMSRTAQRAAPSTACAGIFAITISPDFPRPSLSW